MLTKQEIIDHPDFEKLILFAVKQFWLRPKLNKLGVSVEEFTHEVMTHLWLRGGSNKKLHTLTTTVMNHCKWTMRKLIKERVDNPHQISDELLDTMGHSDNCGPNESAFLLNKAIQKTTSLTAIEHEVLEALSQGMSLRHASKQSGHSLECLTFAHERAFSKIRRANPHGIC